MKIRINNYINESYVDGPGIRFTLFTQGCYHNCQGCHNPQTHDVLGGYEIDCEEIINKILENPLLDGITFSGGEPLLQVEACLYIIRRLKEINLNYDIIIYTGYTFEEILKMGEKNRSYDQLLQSIDYLIDGKFDINQRDLELPFMGSRNQRFIDVVKTLQEKQIVLANL